MKTKLLKKLRKRFRWSYHPEFVGREWQLFDLKSKREVTQFPTRGFYDTERLTLKMTELLRLERYWRSRYEKFEITRLEKLNRVTGHRFNNNE